MLLTRLLLMGQGGQDNKTVVLHKNIGAVVGLPDCPHINPVAIFTVIGDGWPVTAVEITYTGISKLTLVNLRFILTDRTSDFLLGMVVLSLAFVIFLFAKNHFLGQSLKLSRVTLPSVFLGAYFLFMAIPSVLWFSVSNHPIKFTYLVAMQIVPIVFLIGVRLRVPLPTVSLGGLKEE